jgi:UDPglucose 6-dehydrogenase
LIYQLKTAGQPTDMLQSVYNINEYQKTYLLDRAMRESGVRFNHKKVALLGLAFKQRTNDMRDASSLKVVETLLARGVSEIRAYDPGGQRAALLQPRAQLFVPEDHYHNSPKRRSPAVTCCLCQPTGRIPRPLTHDRAGG